MFAESRPFHVAQHRLPAWKVVLAIGGHARLLQRGRLAVAAPGLLVPPQLAHSCAAASPYLALFIDPWLLPSRPGPVPLGAGEVRRLLAALGTTDSDGPGTGADLAAGYAELRRLAGRPATLDPRVAHAVGLCTVREPDMPITSVADEVGLSAPRLRALVRQDMGITLARLRRWGLAPQRDRRSAGFDRRPGRGHRGLRRPGPFHPYRTGLHRTHTCLAAPHRSARHAVGRGLHRPPGTRELIPKDPGAEGPGQCAETRVLLTRPEPSQGIMQAWSPFI
ncbi:hypothetical protein SALBM135S_00989 [Streptomyces alboniger]